LLNAANEDVNCYGGPGRGDVANKSKTGNAPRNIKGDPEPHCSFAFNAGFCTKV
jgi:hypothetical protein